MTRLSSPPLEFIRPDSPSLGEEQLERFGVWTPPAPTGLDRPESTKNLAAASKLLPELESASSPAERRRLFDRLIRSSDPETIVNVAFSEYDWTGREAFLLHAVSLLEAFGKEAWPDLLRVAQSGRPETELFLGLIARCPGVSEAQRASAFHLVAKHAAPSVRLGLLEHLPALGPDRERDILRDLAVSDPDPDVKAEAAGRLSALVGGDD